jgi:hypothetical protein
MNKKVQMMPKFIKQIFINQAEVLASSINEYSYSGSPLM